MQFRVPGEHGKIESNEATGIWAARPNVARGVGVQATLNSNTCIASDLAPYGPPSSWVPTNQFGVPLRGGRAPSQSVGSRPSPVRFGASPGGSRKLITRAFGSPATIFAFSSAYAPMPAKL